MEATTEVKGLQQKYYKVGFGGPPCLRIVKSLSDTATSVRGQVTYPKGMKSPKWNT